MRKKHKLLLGGLLVVVVFFITTFSKNWGAAVSGNLLEKYKPEVKQILHDPKAAAAVCPTVITNLEKGIPELEKSKDPLQVGHAHKLIADCALAAKHYDKALEYYKKLSAYEPNVARWHSLIAEAYVGLGKPGDALHYSILSTQLEPTSFEFKLLNARILARLGLTNRALIAYKDAIKIAPYQEIEPTKRELETYMQDIAPDDVSMPDNSGA